MDQEHVLGLLSFFYPDVRMPDFPYFCILFKPLIKMFLYFFQPKDEQLRKQLLDEYTGTGEDRVKNREGFTELIGDMFFVIPAIKTANAHRGTSQLTHNIANVIEYIILALTKFNFILHLFF